MNDEVPLGTFEEQVMLAVLRTGDEAYGMTVRREIEEVTGREIAVGAVYATLDRLDELVVKEVHGSGGYGMLIGPMADKTTLGAFRDKLKHDPRGFIAQPTLALSTCPTCVEQEIGRAHV